MPEPNDPEDVEVLEPRATKRRKGRGKGRLPRPSKVKVSPALTRAWKQSLYVSDRELNEFVPTEVTILVGEAILAGQLHMAGIVEYSGRPVDHVKDILQSPVAMAWVSRQIHEHFKHRTALIDAALFQRAVGGDIPAIKLWYERHGKLVNESTVHHRHSLELDVTALSTDDLQRMVEDNARLLASNTRIIDVKPAGAGGDVPGAAGIAAPVHGGPAPVLPGDAGQAPEADAVPPGAAQGEQEVPAVRGGQPVGQDNGGAA